MCMFETIFHPSYLRDDTWLEHALNNKMSQTLFCMPHFLKWLFPPLIQRRECLIKMCLLEIKLKFIEIYITFFIDTGQLFMMETNETNHHIVPVTRLEALRALKLSDLENFRALEASNLATGTT